VQQQRFDWLRRRLTQLHPGVQLRQRAQRLDELEQRLTRAWQFDIEQRKRLLQIRYAHLQQLSPVLQLARARTRLNELHHKLQTAIRKEYESSRSRFELATLALNTLSPLATLTRGYAIVAHANTRVITDATKVAVGESIRAKVLKGSLSATVVRIESDEK